MTNGADHPEDLSVIAGEYVLGVLDKDEAAAFETRLVHDEAARHALAEARERFLELDLAAPPEPPSPDLWDRIEARLNTQPPAPVVDLASRRRQSRTPDRSVFNAVSSARFWQGFAAATVLAVIAALIASATVLSPTPRLIVVLLNDQAQPVSIVEAFDGQRIRVVPLDEIDVPPGRTLQVWTLPDPATGPVSMGLLPTGDARTLEGPQLPPPQPDQLYEITIEPEGGSPTGRPTGPIVGKGFARVPQL